VLRTSSSVNDKATDNIIARAKAVAQRADVVVFLGGTNFEKPESHETGTESHDRYVLTLPGNQEQLLKELYSVNKNIVLVLESNSSMDITWEKENLPAILDAWYGGQAQGQAICDVLYGDVNPGGKLTSTWYNSLEELPSATDSKFKSNGMLEYDIDDWGYTYMYYGKGKKNPCQAAKPMYPFGYGLSYTTFSYGDFNIPSNFKIGKTEDVTLKVTNTGTREGDEVIQIYATFPGSTVGRPIKKLVGFQRVTVPVGESVVVTIPVAHENFSYYDENTHTFRTESAAQLQIATSSADEDVKYQQSVNTEAGTVGETYISTHIDEIPAVSQRQLLKTDHIYNVMGAYVGPASCFDRLPKGVYVLNGVKYIKK
jgi:beta-glucosidase